MSAVDKACLLVMALAIGVAFGSAAYVATHPKPPTRVDILICRHSQPRRAAEVAEVSECAPTVEDLAAYDQAEQMVSDGDLCSVDGEPCDSERVEETYGEDRDGNRGIRVHYFRCRKCGEEW